MLLAVVLPFNAISDLLVVLEIELYKAVFVIKMIYLILEDIILSIGYWDSAKLVKITDLK